MTTPSRFCFSRSKIAKVLRVSAGSSCQLVPRAPGGCDEADCVLAPCRSHHLAFDRGELVLLLLPRLKPVWRCERAGPCRP
jgi:hypothetical protein